MAFAVRPRIETQQQPEATEDEFGATEEVEEADEEENLDDE